MIYCSPAKLNLFFRVLKKREDGYHEIASLYQAIGLCDTLTVKLASEDKLFCDNPAIPCDHSNLVLKASELFRRKTGLSIYVHFHLQKCIPIQAGLGGGSSNAATALWALNQLAGKPATEVELLHWSAEIGSDVPFFFSSGSAYCTGRGEILEEVPALSPLAVYIAKPKGGLSTPEVYKNTHVPDLAKRDPLEALSLWLNNQPVCFNDLESAAFKLMPELTVFKNQLIERGWENPAMTGSGTAFFAFKTADKSALQTHFLWRQEGKWYSQ